MELHVTVPPSSDGGYDLTDLPDPNKISQDPDTISTKEVSNDPVMEAAMVLANGSTFASIDDEPPLVDPAEAETQTDLAPAPASAPEQVDKADQAAAKPDAGPKLRRKRKVTRKRWDAPAWGVSAVIHVGVLAGLAAMATGSGEILKRINPLDSSLVSNPNAADELTKIYADPADVPSEVLTGNTDSSTSGAGVGFSNSSASGASVVSGAGRAVSNKTSLPTIPTISVPSGLASTGIRLNRELPGGGMINGGTFGAGDVGEALDQIAREILRHLTQHKVTVVWLFDESESMKDDQKEIRKKFDRVVNELKINAPDDIPALKGKKGAKSSGPPLSHAIVGFGEDVHFEQEKPTADIEVIGRAIERLRIDTTGKENTMSAVAKVIAHYGGLISDERKLLIVLVTDESGDDGDFVEEALQAATSRNVPIYVIGRQSLFGTSRLTIEYIDPVTQDKFWVHIRRGPETADLEALQYDGLHHRWDELPSGFAPYELARISKDTGGIYFLLPSEESLRWIKRREKAYSINTLKEYVPDYESRRQYEDRRIKSPFRQTLFDVIQITNTFPFRHHFPIFPDQLLPAIEEELPKVTIRLNVLIDLEKRLRSIEKLRNREPEKRWQAAYDLMLAQIVAYQIKAYEYRANLQEMAATPPKPKQMPTPELFVEWSLDHSHTMKAPKEKTEKVYAEALHLFQKVIENHPNTPWADLAKDEIDRGFSVQRNEWHHKHSTRYEERRKLVPKF